MRALRSLMLVTAGVGLGGALVAPAAASDEQIAHSSRHGMKIIAKDAGAGWCGSDVVLQIEADAVSRFTSADFPPLVQVIGSRVLADRCPAATRATIVGTGPDGSEAWRGFAEKSGGWSPTTTSAPSPTVTAQAAPAPASAPATTAPAATPATPSAATTTPPPAPTAPGVPGAAVPTVPAPQPAGIVKGSGPMIGDWSGVYACKTFQGEARLDVTLSVHETEGSSFKAWVELADQDQSGTGRSGRTEVTGFFNTAARQLQVKYEDWVDRPLNPFPDQFGGTIDLAGGLIEIPDRCAPNGKIILEKAGDHPKVAERILKTIAEGEALLKTELATPRPNRLVGTLPKGDYKAPDCNGYIAWYNSAPAGQRLRIYAGTDPNSGILAQYADEPSQRYFGSPAYYWLGKENSQRDFQKSCQALRKTQQELYRQIAHLVDDWRSRNELDNRRHDDDRMDGWFAQDMMRGAFPADTYALASAYDTAPEVSERTGYQGIGYQGMGLKGAITMADVQNIVTDAIRYKDMLAAKVVDAKVARIAGTSDDLEGLRTAEKTMTETLAWLGDTPPPKAKQAIDAAWAAKRKSVADHVLAESTGWAGSLDPTMANLELVNARIDEIDLTLGTILSDNQKRDLVAAADAFRQKARKAVLVTATAEVAEAGMDMEAIADLRRRRDAVLTQVRREPALPELTAYEAAVEAKVAEIAKANVGVFQSHLDTIAVNWSALDELGDLRGRTIEQLGEDLGGAYVKAIDSRRATIVKALADQAITDINGMNASYREVDEVEAAVRKAVAPFQDVDAAQRDRVLAAGNAYMTKLLDEGFDQFRIDVGGEEKSRKGAIGIARIAGEYRRRAEVIPAFARYADFAAEQARETFDDSCTALLDKGKVSSGQADRPFLVGSEIIRLRDVLCFLQDDQEVAEYKEPGLLFGGDVYALKLYSEKQGFLTMTLDMMEVKPGQEALTVTQIDDGNTLERVSLKEWRRKSAFAFPGAVMFSEARGRFCPNGKQDADKIKKLRPQEAGVVDLYCNL